MKSESDAQSSRLIIIVLQVGPVKIYAAAVETLRERKDRMKPVYLPPKLVDELVWSLNFHS
jgi:hypothetical protein